MLRKCSKNKTYKPKTKQNNPQTKYLHVWNAIYLTPQKFHFDDTYSRNVSSDSYSNPCSDLDYFNI